MPDVFHATCHAPIFLLFIALLQATISPHSFYLLLGRWIQATHHSTCAQMTLKHKPDRHADLNIDSPLTHLLPHVHASSYLEDVKRFQIRLSHQVMLLKGGRKKKEKKEGKKSTKIDDFSFLHSRPVVCNLLWHSTSSVALFNYFVHRGHKKAAAWEYSGRWLFKKWILMTGESREALAHVQSLVRALKST